MASRYPEGLSLSDDSSAEGSEGDMDFNSVDSTVSDDGAPPQRSHSKAAPVRAARNTAVKLSNFPLKGKIDNGAAPAPSKSMPLTATLNKAIKPVLPPRKVSDSDGEADPLSMVKPSSAHFDKAIKPSAHPHKGIVNNGANRSPQTNVPATAMDNINDKAESIAIQTSTKAVSSDSKSDGPASDSNLDAAPNMFYAANKADLNPNAAPLNDRRDRTVVVSLPEDGKPYKRQDFLPVLQRLNLLSHLEACGPTVKANVWQFAFKSRQAKDVLFNEGQFVTARGHQATVSYHRKSRAYIKLHWIPYDVSMADAVHDLLTIPGIRLISTMYETSRDPGFEQVRTGVRMLILECNSLSDVPHFIQWRSKGSRGKALVTMRGRPSLCLRCQLPGHVKRECKAPLCTKCKRFGHLTNECKASFAAVLKGNIAEPIMDADEPEPDMDTDLNTPNDDVSLLPTVNAVKAMSNIATGETATNIGPEAPSTALTPTPAPLTSIESVETPTIAFITPYSNSHTEIAVSPSDAACKNAETSTGEVALSRPTVILNSKDTSIASSSRPPPPVNLYRTIFKPLAGGHRVDEADDEDNVTADERDVECDDSPRVQAIDMRKRAAASEPASSPISSKAERRRKNKKAKQELAKQDQQKPDA